LPLRGNSGHAKKLGTRCASKKRLKSGRKRLDFFWIERGHRRQGFFPRRGTLAPNEPTSRTAACKMVSAPAGNEFCWRCQPRGGDGHAARRRISCRAFSNGCPDSGGGLRHTQVDEGAGPGAWGGRDFKRNDWPQRRRIRSVRMRRGAQRVPEKKRLPNEGPIRISGGLGGFCGAQT